MPKEWNWCARADALYKHFAQAGRKSPAAMEKRRKRQVLDGTGSRSLNSVCRRLSCTDRLSVDLRQQQHSAALWATKQPSLGTALLAPHEDGPREGGLNKACLTLTVLASRGQQASLPSGKKNERKKKTAHLKVACWNICTMQDSRDCPQRCSGLQALGTSLAGHQYCCSQRSVLCQRKQAMPSSGLETRRKSTTSLVS